MASFNTFISTAMSSRVGFWLLACPFLHFFGHAFGDFCIYKNLLQRNSHFFLPAEHVPSKEHVSHEGAMIWILESYHKMAQQVKKVMPLFAAIVNHPWGQNLLLVLSHFERTYRSIILDKMQDLPKQWF